jgi:carboxyl-terminal processing protease
VEILSSQRTLKVLAVILVLALLAAGSALGFALGYSRGVYSEQTQWLAGDWGKLNQVLYTLEQYYVRDTDREALLEGALYGLVDSLEDPYSEYLSPEEMEEMLIQAGGTYSGIGVEVTMENNRITIMAAFPGSPAEEAGLLPGDQIVQVDGRSIEGLSLNDAVKDIRGEEGTEVTLGIIREGLPNIFQVTLKRARIQRSTVEIEMLANKMGYLALSQFSENSSEEFAKGIRDLKKQGMEGLILDLRDNPGGYLDVIVDIARQLVPQSLIVYTEDRHGNRIEEYSSSLRDRGYPMVVLVNGLSASASEILAGALQDNGVPVVGTTSYGKGTVQRFYPLGDGSYVKLTMARFFTPKGKAIQDNGVKPDYEVEMDSVNRIPNLPFLGTLELGSEAIHVYQLQRMLEAMGYFRGPVTGVYDEATAQAVKEFQRDQGLPAQGKMDMETTDAFNRRWMKYTRTADIQLTKAIEVLHELLREN